MKTRIEGILLTTIPTLIITLLLLAQPAVATETTVSIEDLQAESGSTVNTKILIEGVEDYGTATIELHYDNSVVSVTSVSEGNISNSALIPNIDNSKGVVTIAAYTSEIPGPNGTLVYANLEIEVIGTPGAASQLDLVVEEFAHSDGTSIPAATDNGSIQITSSGTSPDNSDGDALTDEEENLVGSDPYSWQSNDELKQSVLNSVITQVNNYFEAAQSQKSTIAQQITQLVSIYFSI